jgi:hypothetical protein
VEKLHDHYKQVKDRYDEFLRYLLSQGILPARDTGVGYWGVTPLPELFDLFSRIRLKDCKSFMDLGSGDGRVVLLASLFGVHAHGIEYDPWLVNSSIFIRRRLNLPSFANVKIREDNFMNHDLSKFDVVYTSPDKPFHRHGFEQKLLRELTGRLVVHGWEFHPNTLYKEEQHIIGGEKFTVYSKQPEAP